MNFEIRPLCSDDIFPMSKILSKIGIAELKTAFNTDEITSLVKNKKNVESIGVNVMFNVAGIILANLSSCETEIYKFLSNVTGESVETLKKCSMADFAELIIEIVKKDEFKDFIGVVSKLFK